MKKIALVLFAALLLTITSTSYSKTGKTVLPITFKQNRGVKLMTDSASILEIVDASISGDYLNISILVPQYREPDSLQIRNINGSWSGVNILNNSSGQLFFPYVDQYNRQCWNFVILLNGFATPGNTYVLRFTDWTQAADEYLVTY